MRKILLFVSVLFSGISLLAQPLSGTYRNGSDSLVFNGDRVIFRASGFGGLSSAQTGEGTYERLDDFLLIHTSEYPGDKATYQELNGSRSDTCVVKVVSLANYPIEGILVEPSNISRRRHGGRVTANDGRIYLTDIDKTETITVSGMGYNTISIDYRKGHDYLVRLTDYEVIENKTVVFRFNEVDDETLSLLLLTDEFDTTKKREDELKKLAKKARKNNRIDKRFKKEYEPYVRRTHTGQVGRIN